MTKLPRVEKLPLAVRKNLRDDWESRREELTKAVSELFGTEWTLEVDVHQFYAYAQDGYGKEATGSCIAEYFDSNTRRLREFVESHDSETVTELNNICYAHVLVLDVDEDSRFTYNGGDVLDGKFRILFEPSYLSSNISQALQQDVVLKALNDAPAPEGSNLPLSFIARLYKRKEWDDKVEEVRSQIGKALNKPDIKLTPNFEDTFAKLKAESQVKGTSLDRGYWEQNMAGWTLQYFAGLLSQLKWQKFDSDDMLQEGFNEAVEKGEIAFRIVDKLNSSYCEFEIEDGIFYLQCTAKTWGSNITDAAQNIVDKL